MLPTLDLLGGPFKPVSSAGTTTSRFGSASAVRCRLILKRWLQRERLTRGTGVPNAIAAPSDDSKGGSVPTDPTEEAQAAKDALEKEPESAAADSESDGSVALPEHRGFDDQTFILMHAYNLINLRNEKMNFDLDEPPPDKLDDVDGDKKPDDVMSNTIRSIKSGLPYAYMRRRRPRNQCCDTVHRRSRWFCKLLDCNP